MAELELRQCPDLCKLLESVCTARDFLREVGGEEEESLPEFMETLRLYTGEGVAPELSPLRHFTLGHVDSIIKFLSLVRAKIMIRNEQNPFERDIPLEYRVSLPPETIQTVVPDLLKSVSLQWLLPNLFSFIWSKLRAKPSGESNQPNWPLKVNLKCPQVVN